MFYVYILKSQEISRFYIGYTTNIDLRIDFHLKASDQSKFTYNANDWTLFFKIECQSKKQALAIEKHIKKMKSKIYIENLLLYPEIIDKLLLKYIDC